MTVNQPSIEAVRQFWDANPLFAGELPYEPGEKVFFEEHRRITLHDHGGSLGSIFTADVKPRTRLLDVGCGIGFWVHEFNLRKALVSACDLSSRAVQLTKHRLALYGLEGDIREGNAEELPYPDESFDHVNCQGVIHHTPNTQRCLEEFCRVLRPGGTLCFSVYYKVLPLRCRALYRFVSWSTRSWLGMSGRGREKMMSASSPEELVRLYDGSGNPLGKAYTLTEVRAMLPKDFETIEVRRSGFPRRVLPFEMPDFLYRIISRTFGLMIVFRCRKK